MRKNNELLSFTVEPKSEDIIGKPASKLFDSFWQLLGNLNYNIEVETEEYVEIIENLLKGITVNIGDWNVLIDPNDAATVFMLNNTLDVLLKEKENEKNYTETNKRVD